jgi:hypothetical protein
MPVTIVQIVTRSGYPDGASRTRRRGSGSSGTEGTADNERQRARASASGVAVMPTFKREARAAWTLGARGPHFDRPRQLGGGVVTDGCTGVGATIATPVQDVEDD